MIDRQRFTELTIIGDDILQHMDQENEDLSHSGHKGMKWYQHRYGPWQNHAKYASRYGGSRHINPKVRAEAKKESGEKPRRRSQNTPANLPSTLTTKTYSINGRNSLVVRKKSLGEAKDLSEATKKLKDEEFKYEAINDLYDNDAKQYADYSKKYKTKAGDLEISCRYDMKSGESLDNFVSRHNKLAANIDRKSSEYRDTVSNYLYKYAKYWDTNRKISKSDFKGGLKLYGANTYGPGEDVEIFYKDTSGLFGGHEALVLLDPKGKIKSIDLVG